MIGIGIDTGGTCTDAVAFDFEAGKILASAKSPTTHEKLEAGMEASLRKLPQNFLQKASFLALSTTLATNACVEGKGGRVLMIFIGVNEKVVRQGYQSYGFESLEDILFIKGNVREKEVPDWEQFDAAVREKIPFYDSFAVAQMNAEENGGAYEREAFRRIRSMTALPVVCAYELFHDRNVIRRGAGAFLNARLLPVIEEFLEAVRQSLADLYLSLPIVIMRSDGSLMSEDYAREHPVETLLCGPAASVTGGAYFCRAQKAVVIDMGGTTTDIALIRGGLPVRSDRGVQVGNWRTFVKGLYVDTFGLGGDSEVCYNDDGLYLSERRVIPLCMLEAEHPGILGRLDLDEYWKGHSKPMYSFYVLMKEIGNGERYSGWERDLAGLLGGGPRSLVEVTEFLHTDVYRLNTDRLEKEGIVMRSALTPTDMMALKGDFTLYPAEPLKPAVEFLARSVHRKADEIPDLVYRLVEEKLYRNLVRILLQDDFRSDRRFSCSKEIDLLAEDYFASASGGKTDSGRMLQTVFQSDAVFVGVGAPVHVFLPRVAELFHAECLIPEAAGVANAFGALIGDIRAEAVLQIEANYEMNSDDEVLSGYFVYGGGEPRHFEKYEEALGFAKKAGAEAASAKARERGAAAVERISFEEKPKKALAYGTELFLGAEVRAVAVGKIGLCRPEETDAGAETGNT